MPVTIRIAGIRHLLVLMPEHLIKKADVDERRQLMLKSFNIKRIQEFSKTVIGHTQSLIPVCPISIQPDVFQTGLAV